MTYLNLKSIMKNSLFIVFIVLSALAVQAQNIGAPPEYVKALTAKWEGERSADGRPRVSDAMLERLQNCTLEQIWSYLGKNGFHNQYSPTRLFHTGISRIRSC